MPTYSYRCKSCGNEFDIHQSFSDAPLTVCDNCGGELRKLFNSVGVVFKGSGFYHNDSRSSSGSLTATDKPKSSDSSSDSSSSSTSSAATATASSDTSKAAS